MKKNIFFIILIVILLISCKNDIFNFTSFDGYTSRDIEGKLIGVEDSTDWKIEDKWKRKERKLFSDYEDFTIIKSYSDTITIKALPNPATNFIYISLKYSANIKFDYIIVNEKWEILHSENDLTEDKISINVKDYITDEDVIRIYYRFKTDDNKAFIGHGDIKIY